MKFNGLEELEAYIYDKQRNTEQEIDYYFFVEPKMTKEDFLHCYFEFLKKQIKIPIDILNSKIKTFDILYVPLTFYSIHSRIRVDAEIGKHRIVKEFGGLQYNPNNQKQEVFYNNKIETDWYKEEFYIDSKVSNIHCENYYFKTLLTSVFSSRDKVLEKFKSLTYIDTVPEYCHKLNGSPENVLSEVKKLTEIGLDEINNKTEKELHKRGDTFRNVKSSFPENKEGNYHVMANILMPIGYIQYEYNSKLYSFIKILDSKLGTFVKSEYPEDILLCNKGDNPTRNIFLLYIGFWIVFCTAHWYICKNFSNIVVSEKALSICFKLIIGYLILQIMDLLYVCIKQKIVKDNYKNKRKEYLYNIFDEQIQILQQLALKMDKTYKES